ncbi:hypothetical protein D769_30599 [Cupriavidus sp. HMR-1]|uniref:SDR family NAD(P)-dependent oxidoreductase n=1 Tax=Cupriavidus TaxID=106589 RepID=UPI0002A22C3A|nr:MULTISPECIES: SDR family NAD(P)-dependent oxidoreductase [Cupriavidus]EKZ95362.1 hypothetical protein D769_30599 [Cupriavidus sp. HMR-1]
MDRVFVIGATGGTGSLVVQTLLEAGKSVVALVRRQEQAAELVAEVLVALVDSSLRGVVIEVTDGTSSVRASLGALSYSISA